MWLSDKAIVRRSSWQSTWRSTFFPHLFQASIRTSSDFLVSDSLLVPGLFFGFLILFLEPAGCFFTSTASATLGYQLCLLEFKSRAMKTHGNHVSVTAVSEKRKRASSDDANRRFPCNIGGCDKKYIRQEHLRRHQATRRLFSILLSRFEAEISRRYRRKEI